MFAGSLEVFYHEDFFPLAARTALDQLCGLRSPAYAGEVEWWMTTSPWIGRRCLGAALYPTPRPALPRTRRLPPTRPLPRRGDVAGSRHRSLPACPALPYPCIAGPAVCALLSGRETLRACLGLGSGASSGGVWLPHPVCPSVRQSAPLFPRSSPMPRPGSLLLPRRCGLCSLPAGVCSCLLLICRGLMADASLALTAGGPGGAFLGLPWTLSVVRASPCC